MRRLQAVERPLGGLRLGRRRREIDDLLPRLGGALQILLAERPHDADVEQRLDVFRIERERFVELRERFVGLIRVVVGDAEIGAHVDVIRRERQRLLVPLDRIVVAIGVEVEVREIDARLRILRVPFGHRRERLDLRFVEHRGASRSAAGRRAVGLRGLRGRRDGPRRRLLRSDDPAGDQAEAHAGDAESNVVRFHFTWGPAPHPGSLLAGRRHPARGLAARSRARVVRTKARSYQTAAVRPASRFRYSRTTAGSPTKIARETIAWPIDTSSRCGTSRNRTRLSRSRSWPALTPRRSECASAAMSANCANDRRPSSRPRSNARANGSVYSSIRSAPADAAQRIGSGSASTKTLTRMPRACSRSITFGICEAA